MTALLRRVSSRVVRLLLSSCTVHATHRPGLTRTHLPHLPPFLLLSSSFTPCRHSSRGHSRVPARHANFLLPPLSSFASPSAFAFSVLSSALTPRHIKATFTTARLILGADAFELLLSLLSSHPPSSSSPSKPSTSPSSSVPHPLPFATVQRYMEEVRPFAEDFHHQKSTAKLRLVPPRSSAPPSASSSASPRRKRPTAADPLDPAAWASLTHSIHSLTRHLPPPPPSLIIPPPRSTHSFLPPSPSPSPSPSSTSSTPSSSPSPPSLLPPPPQPIRAMLERWVQLLPPAVLQLLLRDVSLDVARPYPEGKTWGSELLKRRIRWWLSQAGGAGGGVEGSGDAREAVKELQEEYARRRRTKADWGAEVNRWWGEVGVEDVARLNAEWQRNEGGKAEAEDSLEAGSGTVSQKEWKERLRERQLKEKEEREVERAKAEGEAAQEVARVEGVRAQAERLGLPSPPPLPTFYPHSSVPIDSTALTASLLPHPHWTVTDLRFLNQLQTSAHPLAYHHFRLYLLTLSSPSSPSSPTSPTAPPPTNLTPALLTYASLLFPNAARVLSALPAHLPTLLTGGEERRVGRKGAVSLCAVDAVPPLDLQLERHAFLHHLMQQALPSGWMEVYLEWWRWQTTTREEAKEAAAAAEAEEEGGEELKRLDQDIEQLKTSLFTSPSPSTTPSSPSSDPFTAPPTSPSEPSPPKRRHHSRTTVIATGARALGARSPLLQLLRLHVDHLTAAEWREARRWSPEGEDNDYLAFHVTPPPPTSPPPATLTEAYYRQKYPHPLLERSPSLSVSLFPMAAARLREEGGGRKLWLYNVPADMGVRELCYALRRLGEVVGGEVFRERMKMGVMAMEMMKERESRGTSKKGEVTRKVLKVAGHSPVYAAVYFSPSSPPLDPLPLSLSLFGVHYRHASLYAVLPSSVTRLQLTSPALRSTYTYPALMQHLTALMTNWVGDEAVVEVGVGGKEALQENGSVVVELRGHEEAMKVWERLRVEEFGGRRARVSWVLEDRERVEGVEKAARALEVQRRSLDAPGVDGATTETALVPAEPSPVPAVTEHPSAMTALAL